MNLLIEASEERRSSAVVAVITRTKDRPFLLERAVRSVLKQTFQDWLHVVVNDGGDPAPVERLLRAHAQVYAGRVILMSAEESLGMEAASNLGIRGSVSDYVLIHDDDDSLQPAFLERALGYLDAANWPTLKGVITLSNLVYERIEGDTIVVQGTSLYREMSGCVGIAEMAVVNQFPPISFLYHRDVLDEIGLYDERLPVLGDWDFNLRFLSSFDIGVFPEPLANYHQRPTTSSAQYGNSLFAQKERHAFYDRIIRNGQLRAAHAQGMPALGLLLNIAMAGGGTRGRRRLFDPLYRVPGVTSAIRWLRRRGLLLGLTRDV